MQQSPHPAHNEFGRSEFRCRCRKVVVHLQTRMAGQKILDFTATMNRVLVPDHHNGSRNAMEQMLQKDDDFIAGERDGMGLKRQLDLAFPRAHWKTIRTTNVVERLFEEVKKRST